MVLLLAVFIVVSAVGLYGYSSESSRYSSLSRSYSNLSARYGELEQLYQAALSYARGNYTLYQEAESNYTYYRNLYEGLTGLEPGAALEAVLELYDGISIESASDVLPLLASNFTAVIEGAPMPGTYDLSSFNSTWLAGLFSAYETVYYYTTALPTVTQVAPGVYNVSDVVQFFVAPTSDPVYLKVINASNVVTVQIIGGRPLITRLVWRGNLAPPSAVIAGYPSQHALQADQALEVVLSQLNALGAELPPSTIAQGVSPSAQLVLEGQLPPAFKAGTYSGLQSIEDVFSEWDQYFVFALVYAQNLLPNGTAVAPSVTVNMLSLIHI